MKTGLAPHSLTRGSNSKLYEVFPDGSERELVHISDPKYNISTIEPKSIESIFSITDCHFPSSFQASQNATKSEATTRKDACRPKERDSEEEANPQSRDSEKMVKAVLRLAYKSAFLSEERVPEEEVKINQLPNSKPLKLLPPPKFNPLNDKPSNNPETVTCCCNLFQMFCGALK